MENINLTSQIANLLRPLSSDVMKGMGTLCLSDSILNKLNQSLDKHVLPEDMNSSFQRQLSSISNKTTTIIDGQFLLDLVQTTVCLKVVPDIIKDTDIVNLTRFDKLKQLHLNRIDINTVTGLQKLRLHLQRLSVNHSCYNINDVLSKCGADESCKFIWNELKAIDFSHNAILELDRSFELTPWLHTLDLSHNELTKVETLNVLQNLKHLNLSYNKLTAVPHFKGPICIRLQTFILHNNFIEDIQALSQISNLLQIDLSHNSLLEHKSLLSISHLPSLQLLNLTGNPISFHPQHRTQTCNYLNANISQIKFSLDNKPMTKQEKMLTGSLYPILSSSLTSSSSIEDCNTVSSYSEKLKKVRNVEIEDDNTVKAVIEVAPSPSVSSPHLDIKKQVEQLRKEFGEDWLVRSDVFESSTPFESALSTLEISQTSEIQPKINNDIQNISEIKSNISEMKSDISEMKSDSEFDSYKSADEDSKTVVPEEVQSDEEDVYIGGEECMYLATIHGLNQQVFVVVTPTHISERDCSTSKEIARWHTNTVLTCEIINNSTNIIKIEFDTVRRDRKQRVYVLDEDEALNFINSIQLKIESGQITSKLVSYQCMKCFETFIKNKSKNMLEEIVTITCPSCESNLVIESV